MKLQYGISSFPNHSPYLTYLDSNGCFLFLAGKFVGTQKRESSLICHSTVLVCWTPKKRWPITVSPQILDLKYTICLCNNGMGLLSGVSLPSYAVVEFSGSCISHIIMASCGDTLIQENWLLKAGKDGLRFTQIFRSPNEDYSADKLLMMIVWILVFLVIFYY